MFKVDSSQVFAPPQPPGGAPSLPFAPRENHSPSMSAAAGPGALSSPSGAPAPPSMGSKGRSQPANPWQSRMDMSNRRMNEFQQNLHRQGLSPQEIDSQIKSSPMYQQHNALGQQYMSAGRNMANPAMGGMAQIQGGTAEDFGPGGRFGPRAGPQMGNFAVGHPGEMYRGQVGGRSMNPGMGAYPAVPDGTPGVNAPMPGGKGGPQRPGMGMPGRSPGPAFGHHGIGFGSGFRPQPSMGGWGRSTMSPMGGGGGFGRRGPAGPFGRYR